MCSVFVDLYNQKPMSWHDTNCHPTWFTLVASLNLQIGSKDLLLLAIWASLFLAQLMDSLLKFWLVYHKLVFVPVIWFSLAILYWCCWFEPQNYGIVIQAFFFSYRGVSVFGVSMVEFNCKFDPFLVRYFCWSSWSWSNKGCELWWWRMCWFSWNKALGAFNLPWCTRDAHYTLFFENKYTQERGKWVTLR